MNTIPKGAVWSVGLGLGVMGLVSCGGGLGEALLILGYAGSGGGTYALDGNPSTAAFEPATNCGPGGNSPCQITLNVQGNAAVPFPNPLFDHSYAVTTTGPGVLGGSTRCDSNLGVSGTVVDRRLDIPGCFTGNYRSVNEVVSDDGRTRLLFNYQADYTQGAWYDIRNDKYRLKFTSAALNGAPTGSTAKGCEINDTTKQTVVQVDYTDSDIFNVKGPVFASIQEVRFLRPGAAVPEKWNAEIVGASGLKLTRGSQTLELERRRGTAADIC